MLYSGTQDEQSRREEQIHLEEEHDNAAVVSVLKERREYLESGDAVYHPQVHSVSRAAIPRVKEVLQTHAQSSGGGPYARFRKVLRAIDPDILAAATVIAVFSHYFSVVARNKPVTFQGLARFVGHATVVELIVAQARAVNPMYVSQVSEKLESKNVTDYRHIENVFRSAYNQIMPDSMQVNFTPTEYIHIGKFGVDACYEAGILLIERTYGKGGTIISYHLNPEVEDYIYSGGGESTMARIISST